MDFETDFLSPVGLDTDTVDAMKVVMEYVEAENTQVNRDYEEALREKAVADSVDGNIQEALAGDLANG